MDLPTTADDPSQPQAPKRALLTIFAVVLVDMLGFGLMIPLLPFYAKQFEATAFQVTLLFAIFSACQFVATPLLGAWSDRVGRRPVLALSLIGSAAGYALLAWASAHHWTNLAMGLWAVYLSRIIDGLTAGNISAAQAYISDVTTAKNRTKGMGAIGAAFGLGFSMGPAMGSFLAGRFSLAAPAWLACFLALVAATMAFTLVRDTPKHVPTSATNYFHPREFAPLLANKPLMGVNIAWFVVMGAYVAADSAIVLFLNQVFHYAEREVTHYFILVGVVVMVTQGALVGRLSKRYGDWRLCILGLLLSAAGGTMTGLTAWWPLAWLLVVGTVVVAFGRSLVQPTISAIVSHCTDPKEQGRSFGLFQGVGTLSRVVGPIAAGLVFTWHESWPWLFGSAFLVAAAFWLARVAKQLPTARLVEHVASKVGQ